MARPKIDLHQKVRELLEHTEDAPEESGSPVRHFESSMNDTLSALRYIDDHVTVGSIYAAVYEGHFSHVRRMALGNLIQAFERFIKETAIVCVDHVANFVHDNRYEKFDDLRFTRQFLHVVATAINELVGQRLAELLTELHEDDSSLFDAMAAADMISKKFNKSLSVDGQVGVV